MDFDRTEILNPNSVIIAPVNAFDLNNPVWDTDNDLLVSKNGVYIDFPKPIEDFEWLEITIANTDIAIPNLQINCYTENTVGDFINKSIETGLLDYFGTLSFRVPNIKRIERIRITGIPNTAPYVNKFIAVKSIKVVKKSRFFTRQVSSTVVPVMGAGWAYDSTNQRWVRNFAIGFESVAFQASCAFASTSDYCCVRIYTQAQDGVELFPIVFDQYTMTMFGQDVELDYSGNPDKQAFPINVGILGPAGGGNVYVEFRYGSFLLPVNVFGGNAQPSTPLPNYVPPASGASLVDSDNTWHGINDFEGPVIFNSSVKIDNLTGYLKAAAGIIGVVATIPVADITGLGTSAIHPVGDFFQVANNLNEGVPATMRASLGLGTMAVQNANGVVITGGTIDGVTVGVTTPAAGRFTDLKVNAAAFAGTEKFRVTGSSYHDGNSSINQAPNVDYSLYIGKPTGTGISQRFIDLEGAFPATTTNQAQGIISLVTTAAAAFTLPSLIHYYAFGAAKGAGSTITSAYGFYAQNQIAVGSSNYGFYSDINTATNTFQAYLSGTARSYINGGLMVNVISGAVGVSLNVAQPTDGTSSLFGIRYVATAPATDTTLHWGVSSNISTAASAFTLTDLNNFVADSNTKGAGSTITNVRGFYAANAIAVGSSNYAFFSDINTAANTWQLYMSGTGVNYFAAAVGIGTNNPLGLSTPSIVGIQITHPSAATTVTGYNSVLTLPATATGISCSYRAELSTVASAFVVSDAALFLANTLSKGAGSTITNGYGFFASLGMTGVATNTYGFFCNFANAATTYAFYGSGTAQSQFGGSVAIVSGGTGQVFCFNIAGTHVNAGAGLSGVVLDLTFLSTCTTNSYGYNTTLRTTAAAYTVTTLAHYVANSVVKGAGSSITNLYGFYAGNSITVAVGTICAGFYCDIGAATNTYQLYMGGSAESRFLGVLAVINKSIVEAEATVTYSASMTIDAATGNEQIITVTNATAFTINAPTNPRTGQYLEITIRNTSGGAAGVATWNAVFKMVAWVQPATAFSRTIVFRYNGTNWVEKGRTAADVPN